jgi:DNA-binding GntR family transcriptional regulator
MAGFHMTKTEYAYRELRSRVLDGRIERGTWVNIQSVSQELALSAVPVREALRRLQAEGLVEFESHRGVKVAHLSIETIVQYEEVRLWLEILGVRQAAELHDEASLLKVRQALDDDADAVASGDPYRCIVTNRDFHEAACATARQATIDVIAEARIRVWQARSYCSLYVLRPSMAAASHQEHRAIFEALLSRDPDQLDKAAHRHRDTTLRAWRAVIDSDFQQPGPAAGTASAVTFPT